MSLTIDIVIAGAVVGGMYALVAMGLTLQYGVARIMNLSHGESLIAAAFGAHWAFAALAINPLLGLVIAIPLGFVANWLIYQILLIPLVRRAKNRGMLEVGLLDECHREPLQPAVRADEARDEVRRR